jgi:hypothetical protein
MSSVFGEDGGVAVQFGLEDGHNGLRHCIMKRVADGADRRRGADLVEAVGVEN